MTIIPMSLFNFLSAMSSATVAPALSAIQKDRDRLKKTGKIIGGLAATVAIGTPVYKKAKSLIGG